MNIECVSTYLNKEEWGVLHKRAEEKKKKTPQGKDQMMCG